jgi:hypothetical protein
MRDFCQVKKLVKLYVTPSMLRSWADGMERKWPRMVAGESIVWHDMVVDNDVELQICYDQQKMDDENIK